MLSIFVLFASTLVLPVTESGSVYLFTYFTDNGQDGLHFASSQNGLDWEAVCNGRSFLLPQLGDARLMRDPSITVGPDGRFHLVWTTGWWEKGIGIAHSVNLYSWSDQQWLGVMEHEPSARNSWAPEIFFDPPSGRYYIVWATTIPGRFPSTDHSGDDALNHRLYVTQTEDFKDYSPTCLFYDPGFNVIDGTIVSSGNRYVLVLKNETRTPPEKNIRLAFSGAVGGPYGEASEAISGDYWAEGPSAIRIGDYWYVYFDRYREGRYGAVRSKDMNTWEEVSDRVTFPAGMRHGTVLEVEPGILQGLKDHCGQ